VFFACIEQVQFPSGTGFSGIESIPPFCLHGPVVLPG